jgi:hypothetical protein
MNHHRAAGCLDTPDAERIIPNPARCTDLAHAHAVRLPARADVLGTLTRAAT